MAEAVLIDTGPLVALYKLDDQYHSQCSEAAQQLSRGVFTCWPVLTEVAWLLRSHPDALKRLFDDIQAGIFVLADLDREAVPWIRDFMDKYRDLPAQLADACLVYLAESRGIDTVFTLDRRDFAVYRLSDGGSLTVIPK